MQLSAKKHQWRQRSYHQFLCASNYNNDEANFLPSHYTSPSVLTWLQKMADSYKIERGEDLLEVITRESSIDFAFDDSSDTHLQKLAKVCATTNLPIASHDFLRDTTTGNAIYIYGNLAFLNGFGYEWDEFVQLPSRKCVETEGEVEERQRLLDSVKKNAVKQQDQSLNDSGDNAAKEEEDGASKYDNLIRVRKDGNKILLKGVNLWNVYDICLQQLTDDSTTITIDAEEEDRIRTRVEQGDIKAIGQAVWIRHVDYL